MAVISPFPALRYDPKRVGGLEKVLTQPYDKITPEMQKEYLRRSPYNMAHIVKGEASAEDSPQNNVYTRAAALCENWRRQGILLRQPAPAFYAYWQQFQPPDGSSSRLLVRKGLVGLGKLEPYDSGVVFRHEQTLSAPKADRLELLRATRSHFEQIFMLYSDPERWLDRLLDEEAAKPPVAQVKDEYGVTHQLWGIEDPGKIQAIRQHMLDKKLIIADGHHRYETALNFQRECRTSRPHADDSDCSHMAMAFFNMDSEGILILPTHRLVSGIAGFNRESFLSKAGAYFHAQQYPFASPTDRKADSERLRASMALAAESGVAAFGAVFQEGDAFYLFRLREDVDIERLWPELTPAQRSLDVTILHRIAFAECLGMDEEAVREEKFLTYVRDFGQGAQSVVQGKAQGCFFLHPVKIEQMRQIALEGRVLPQKSTDFYPKLLSGLVIYQLHS